MQESGLFTPLFLGAALNCAAFIFMWFFLVEPAGGVEWHFEEDVSEEDKKSPEKLDKKLMLNVVAGALLDNIGSSGLWPMALTPLAFETFYSDFLAVGKEPIMSENEYRWISMLLALTVVPGAMMTGPVFARVGAAGGCVFGNVVTAVGISACILIATQIDPPTQSSYIGYVVFLYLINPFTVLSNLSTGPMLDMLAPKSQRGFVQGLNVTIMNLARAGSPFVLGIYADEVGTEACMWTCVGVSILAAVVNLPLTFSPALKVHPPPDYAHTALDFEDTELVEKIMKGDWVPLKVLTELNTRRYRDGLPFLTPPVRSYEDDKDRLNEMRKNAREDFAYQHFQHYFYLRFQDTAEHRQEIVDHLNRSASPQQDLDKTAEDLGKWFADYGKDNGYFMDGSQMAPLMKQMIMYAFPPINRDGKITAENLTPTTLRVATIANDYFLKSEPTRAQVAFRNSVVD